MVFCSMVWTCANCIALELGSHPKPTQIAEALVYVDGWSTIRTWCLHLGHLPFSVGIPATQLLLKLLSRKQIQLCQMLPTNFSLPHLFSYPNLRLSPRPVMVCVDGRKALLLNLIREARHRLLYSA